MRTSNFPSRYKGSQFIIASSRGPISPIVSSKGPNFPNYTMRYVLIKSVVLKNHNSDKRVQSLSRGVCVGGVKGIRLWSMGRGSGESVVHGPRTSSLRHCTHQLKFSSYTLRNEITFLVLKFSLREPKSFPKRIIKVPKMKYRTISKRSFLIGSPKIVRWNLKFEKTKNGFVSHFWSHFWFYISFLNFIGYLGEPLKGLLRGKLSNHFFFLPAFVSLHLTHAVLKLT